jgi:hypothetical protein
VDGGKKITAAYDGKNQPTSGVSSKFRGLVVDTHGNVIDKKFVKYSPVSCGGGNDER